MANKKTAEIINLQLRRFFSGDILNFKEYPDEEVAAYFRRKAKRNSLMDITSIKGTALYSDIIDLFKSMMADGKPYAYTSAAFRYMLHLHEFMLQYSYMSFSEITSAEKATAQWCEFWQERNRPTLPAMKNIINASLFALREIRDTRTGLDRNYWPLSEISISKERLNLSGSYLTLNFWDFKESDREYYKMYFRNLLANTELAYSTISRRFSALRDFSLELDKPLMDIANDDVRCYISKKNIKDEGKNEFLRCIQSLFSYLSIRGIYSGKNPVRDMDFFKEAPNYIRTALPLEVFIELFNHIQELPMHLRLIFLIDAFTGIRISDICQLRLDCLRETDGNCFLVHSIQKMQDEGSNLISRELYDMIKDRIAYIQGLGYGETYLFPSESKRNCPYKSVTYRNKMKAFVAGWGIKYPDGNVYEFATHVFRHTISTQLYNMGMSPALIQLGILHHKEIDMSRHYIELGVQAQKKIVKEKLKSDSEMEIKEPLPADSPLPNGFCHMPVRIKCENINACLTCKYFRTDARFLDVHKKQVEELRKKIEYYRVNGYEQNVKLAEKHISALELIISNIEGTQEEVI